MNRRPPISPRTQVCAVIGNPVAHSLSPAVHNAGYEHLGLDFVYLAHRVEDVKSALTAMRALENFRGMSVTIPHKIEAMRYLDEIETKDRKIGAINTVVREKDRLVGLGTDGPGALKALTDSGAKLETKTILMLGAGGAARAIAFTLALQTSIGALILLDIDDAARKTLAADLAAGTSVSVLSRPMTDDGLSDAMGAADVIVHCTPVGMHPQVDASLVPPKLFRAGQVVFDAVYTPIETKLIRQAASLGLKTISGVEMFVHQAALQFERFTGMIPPVEVMRQTVLQRLTS